MHKVFVVDIQLIAFLGLEKNEEKKWNEKMRKLRGGW